MTCETASPGPGVGPRDFKLGRDLLRRLARPAPVLLLASALLEWALIAGCVAWAAAADTAWVSLVSIAFIATRQHALLMLMHEFSHRQFSRSRHQLNDILGDLLTALPLGITIHGFRRNHLAHHRAPGTSADPNWLSSLRLRRYRFPMSKGWIAWTLISHCLGGFTLQDIKGYLFEAGMGVAAPPSVKLRQFTFYACALAATWVLDLWVWVAAYWLLPMSTVLLALLYLRAVGEHWAMPGRGIETARTIVPTRLETLLIAPYAASYHTEHHLFPAVPFCRLKRLHAELSRQPWYREHAVVTQGYACGLLAEVTRGDADTHLRGAGARLPP